MTSSAGALRPNRLLAGLSDVAWDRVRHHLVPVHLPLRKVLYEPGVKCDNVYFPTTAIVSLQYELANGACSELAVVGNEGVVGIALILNGDTIASRAVVDRPGNACRLDAPTLKEEFCRGGAMRDWLLRYTQVLIAEMAQTAVCNRHHSVDQQMCRWLAGRLDRQHSSELIATHELIAAGLGVRRESVTAAAASLRHSGVIRYRRGHIVVLDRRALEERCCECYMAVKQESDRLLQIPARLSNAGAPKSHTYRRALPIVEYATPGPPVSTRKYSERMTAPIRG